MKGKAAPKKPAKDLQTLRSGAAKKPSEQKRFAVIRVRGINSVRGDIQKTLTSLRLYRKNFCVILQDSPAVRGMLQKAKDYITWGEVDDKTFLLLVEKRGELYAGRTEGYHTRKFVEVKGKKLKPYFRLHPPIGGFERKGIKKAVSVGGALGYRAEKINKLIQRMVVG